MTSCSEHQASVFFAGDNGQRTLLPIDILVEEARIAVIPRPSRSTSDERVDSYIEPHQENWFRRFAIRDLRPYGYVLVASLIANALSLAGVMFSMQDIFRIMGPNTAEYLHMSDQIGTLEPGKLADIVLLEGNPLDGIQSMLKAKVVLKGGKIVVDKRLAHRG